MSEKLTKRLVDAAEGDPTGKQAIIWDSEVKGFGLRITPGSKSYIVNYRTAGGVMRRLTIGKHGSPWTCEDARKRAVELLREVAAGSDPLTNKAAEKEAMTVEELTKEYFRAADAGAPMGKGGRPKRTSTLEIDKGRVARHIIPLIGKKKVKDLGRADISKFIADVTAGKTAADVKTDKLRGRAIVEGGAGTASRTAGLLSGILTFAVEQGIITVNPVHGVKRPADGKRRFRFSDDHYRALGKALTEAEDAHPLVVAAVRLLALTGCRKGEVEALKWSEIDEAGKCLRLTDSKEGYSVRPIGQPVLDVLALLPREGEYVLPGGGAAGHFAGLPKAFLRISKAAELPSEATMHTLRHGFASVAADMGYSDSTIAAMLGHSTHTTTSRYTHHLDAVLIAAADRVAGEIKLRMKV
ncbi:site-specific integrase [Magnetospirillum sp. 15-1]|uniref:site-specific integrase n=1 Tax=Magnetospirillum sp. 15-1 TaxID=1979370 RepID=UPI000BBC140C|nr:site-specific integrase [Magnetospirillum sp. 15-1]